jgi:hypothetical protein
MRAATAAAYVDEHSARTSRAAVGRLYPHPVRISGKGERWLREDLDRAIERIAGRTSEPEDAVGLL